MTERIARLHISLADSDPEIWRRVDVPTDFTLKQLHGVIQALFEWQDYHLYEFGADGARAGQQTTLAALLERRVEQFEYVYDLGDDWLHLIRIEEVMTGEPDRKYPRYIDGAQAGPPEDCGGVPGFYEFIAALADPDHPDHADMLDWYGGPFDPGALDQLQLGLRIGQIAKRRHAGKLSAARRKAKKP